MKPLAQSIDFQDGQGLEVATTRKIFNPRWNRQTSVSTETQLTDGGRWLSAPMTLGARNTIDWCDAKHRANASRPWKLGRRRSAVPTDISQFQPGQRPWADGSILRDYHNWSATIDQNKDQNENQSTITLTLTAPEGYGDRTLVFSIDTKRNVVLSMESTQDGKLDSRNTYSDHVQVAGCWWPQTIKTFDDENYLTSEVKQTIKVLPKQAFADRYAALKPDENVYQLIDSPTPTVAKARAAADGATAGFDDYLVLILDACRIQNWDMALELLEKLEALAADKPCVKAIKRDLLVSARRNHDALLACRTEIDRLAADGDPDETYIALQLIQQVNFLADDNERLEFFEMAKPILERNKDQAGSLDLLNSYRLSRLQGLDRTKEAIALQREMSEAAPWDYNLQISLAQSLSDAGEYEAGVALLEKQIKLDTKWRPNELARLYVAAAKLLQTNQQPDKRLELLKRWSQTKTNNGGHSTYLSALVKLDRIEQANELAKQWMQSSMLPEELPSWELTRLSAAINFALGKYYSGYQEWMDPEWYEPLSEVAQFFLKHEHNFDILNQFLVDSPFVGTEQAKQAMRMAAELLKNSAAKMKPKKLNFH